MQNTEKRFSSLVQAVMTKTEKLEQVLVRQLSYRSEDAVKNRRGVGLRDSNNDEDEIYTDEEDTGPDGVRMGSSGKSPKRARQL